VRIVIFGLTVSSSWGNGHATTWRGLLAALHRAGHAIQFFERDAPYYAASRDLPEPSFCELVLYRDWEDVLPRARAAVAAADFAIVSSFCPDGLAAGRLVVESAAPVRAFYDLDTPRTLADLASAGVAAVGDALYLDRELVPAYDLVLSFTGGPLLRALERDWGARRAVPLYCSVDPSIHHPVAAPRGRVALAYLGTYSADRQPTLDRLLVEPARRHPGRRFVVAGSLYPDELAWPANVDFLGHLPPEAHPAFYCSGRLTLNVTREAMRRVGYCPSVRLFEAASCGTPILSDSWPGLDDLLRPGQELLIADTTEAAEDALDLSDRELDTIAAAARARVLAEHSAAARARELVAHCEAARSPASPRRGGGDRAVSTVAVPARVDGS
jgi:spore maturation protein CgeB